MRYAIIVLSLFCSMSFAQASASALDSIEENVIGFALNGWAKGGILSSTLESKSLPEEESVSEYLAFTDFNLSISARPSNETKATFDLRFHKDWQSAYREGNNSPIIRWWSYDGNILNKKLKFNLGTMRIAYTPLTVYLPEPELIMEPEIFASLKKDAMEERYLDGTNRRLLQGLNLEYAISAGIFDKIFLQGTVARLRRVADGTNRISFDFDPNKDRFSMGARIGIETNGVYFGANDIYTFNRFSSSVKNKDTLDYEKNNVLSFELSYNSKKLLEGPVSFGIGAEYALSNWSWYQHVKVPREPEDFLYYDQISDLPSTAPSTYPNYKTGVNNKPLYKLFKVDEEKFKGALLGNAFVQYNENPFEAKLSGHFLNTDKNFEAELAASPAYLPNPNLPILNSDATLEYNLRQFRAGSLENMYYSLYYTLPLNAITIVSGPKGEPNVLWDGTASTTSFYQSPNLYNNYKFAQYYRNAYTQQTYTRLERSDTSFRSRIDPAASLALPNGYATPDRSGGDADLNFVLNKAASIRGVFGMYSSFDSTAYTRFGGGLEVNIARLADLSNALIISGSYEQNKEEKGEWNTQTDRIMAGAKIGIWRGLSLIGGFQQLNKEFKKPCELPNAEVYLAVNKTNEVLLLGGPQIKISERANFVLQGGLLSNKISFVLIDKNEEMELNKYIMSGTVTVEF